jgi:site-specific recombinase XerD
MKFALRRKWIDENPALDLTSPKIKLSPTLPFSGEEMQTILEAVGEKEGLETTDRENSLE